MAALKRKKENLTKLISDGKEHDRVDDQADADEDCCRMDDLSSIIDKIYAQNKKRVEQGTAKHSNSKAQIPQTKTQV